MGEEDNEGGSRKSLENLSFQLEKYPRDLLHRFMLYSGSNSNNNSNSAPSYAHPSEYKTPNEETEELELNLGLSLGGKFGVDKSSKKLMRSSSVAGAISFIKQDESTNIPPIGSCASLIRSSSLPVETEEEWRKRKELQTLRRMEAKRRRSEKQKNFKGEKEGNEEGKTGSDGVVNWRDNSKPKSLEGSSNRVCNMVALPFGLSDWMSKDFLKGGVDGGSIEKGGVLIGCGSGSSGGGSDGGGAGKPNSQVSMESQGGSSSGLSESENKSLQGSGNSFKARTAVSNQSLQGQIQIHRQASCPSGALSKEMVSWKPVVEVANPSKPRPAENRGKEIRTNAMEDMPCVFTKGSGPNGRRIEGILYKYGKGEEVRIMCVCHGKFLSPGEFVKHAGGDEVSHPLRHIVINPNPSFLR